MGILTKNLVWKAISLAEPGVLAILNHPGATWGPKWVAIFVDGPGLAEPQSFHMGENLKGRWSSDWGKPSDYDDIAKKKLEAVSRERESTRSLVSNCPWLFEKGEFLYVGGVFHDGISVAVSGAAGTADEAIAAIIVANIRMLCFFEVEKKIKVEDEKVR